jgi:hypothetical protein
VPNASSGGNSSIHARGRKSGWASISRAITGSALRRNSLALGSATAAVRICASLFAIVATADHSLSRLGEHHLHNALYGQGRERPTAASRSATGTNKHHDLAVRLFGTSVACRGHRCCPPVAGRSWRPCQLACRTRGSPKTSASRLTTPDIDSADVCRTVRNSAAISPSYSWKAHTSLPAADCRVIDVERLIWSGPERSFRPLLQPLAGVLWNRR